MPRKKRVVDARQRELLFRPSYSVVAMWDQIAEIYQAMFFRILADGNRYAAIHHQYMEHVSIQHSRWRAQQEAYRRMTGQPTGIYDNRSSR